jgi:hypothetical protein
MLYCSERAVVMTGLLGYFNITDMGNEESIDTISHDEVLEATKMQNQRTTCFHFKLLG